MQRRQFSLFNFTHICQLVRAGNGEFYFFNNNTGVQFCLKFRKDKSANAAPFSYVSVGICHKGLAAGYIQCYKIGRYSFEQQGFQEWDRCELFGTKKELLFKSFHYIMQRVNQSKPFPPELWVYYSGHCCRCGTELKNSESLKNGFGDCCQAEVSKLLPQQLQLGQGL